MAMVRGMRALAFVPGEFEIEPKFNAAHFSIALHALFQVQSITTARQAAPLLPLTQQGRLSTMCGPFVARRVRDNGCGITVFNRITDEVSVLLPQDLQSIWTKGRVRWSRPPGNEASLNWSRRTVKGRESFIGYLGTAHLG
jgi:hypothetical protein